MTPNPSEPDTEHTNEKALQLFDELLNLSTELLAACQALDPPKVEQLIVRRGLALEKAGGVKLGEVSPATRRALQEKLAAYAALEPRIETGLVACRVEIADQLKAYKESKALLNKYKLSLRDGPPNTRSRDA